ncbi:MAG: FAD-dependent thymidylate synthase [Patescibacteria group bacterium]
MEEQDLGFTVVEPGFIIEKGIDGEQIISFIEKCGKVCYKSEAGITPDSARKFVAKLVADGHESVLEHRVVTVWIVCDRGVSHEIVRHRIASYSQESTRFCNYGKRGIQFIRPLFFNDDTEEYRCWLKAMGDCAKAYNNLLANGTTPQEARSCLPNSTKTEIVVTYNLREWRHFFRLRTAPAAHPQMRQISVPLLLEFQRLIPVIFDDIVVVEK